MLGRDTRTLLRQPSFTLAAAGTLALGIAATTTSNWRSSCTHGGQRA